jgi:hypothetical protein
MATAALEAEETMRNSPDRVPGTPIRAPSLATVPGGDQINQRVYSRRRLRLTAVASLVASAANHIGGGGHP